MKRITAFVLVVLMALAVCCCAQKETSEEFTTVYDAETGEINFDGYVCDIRMSDTGIFHYKEETELADAVLARYSEIEKEYNCTITMTWGEARLKECVIPVMVGNYIGEIGHDHCPQEIVGSHTFYPMEYVETLDMTDYAKYGSAQYNTVGMYRGERFSVSAYQWPGKQMTYTYNIIEISGNNVKKYGLTDPRDVYESGLWTWDYFDANLDSYDIVDGDRHIPAFNNTWAMWQTLSYTNGASLSEISSGGTFTCGLLAQNAIEAMEYEFQLLSNHKDVITALGYYDMTDAFVADKLMLSSTSFSHMINDTIFNVDNYGIVPFPCGPNGEYGKNGGALADVDSFMIFNTAKEPDAAGYIINLLCEPFDAYKGEDGLRRYARTIFYDERDIDWFLKYRDYLSYGYFPTEFGSVVSNMEGMIKSGKGAAETVDKYRDMLIEKYEEVVLPNEMAYVEKWSVN